MNLALIKSAFAEHLRAAAGTLLIVIPLGVWLHFDRMPPLEYIRTELSPSPAVEGGSLTVTRYVNWTRKCDGEIYRELVRPNGQLVNYTKNYRPYPYRLGEQSGSTTFRLPTMLMSGEQSGVAIYRGRLRFLNCGVTSRWWPIEVSFQEVSFPVVARQDAVPVAPR